MKIRKSKQVSILYKRKKMGMEGAKFNNGLTPKIVHVQKSRSVQKKRLG
jgi:hypothetical protein